MALTKETLQQFIALQTQDAALDKLRAEMGKIPEAVSGLKVQGEARRASATEFKNQAIALEKKKKERELDLAKREEAVKKHGAELNSVKTNEAFKALQSEIERAKTEASQIETEILEIMEESDGHRRQEKEFLSRIGSEEKKIQEEVSTHERRLAELTAQFDAAKGSRDQAAQPLPPDVMRVYEHVRSRGKLNAIVPIEGSSCSACRINLAPHVIVEATKMKTLITCESCQRILYRPEVLAPASAPSVAS